MNGIPTLRDEMRAYAKQRGWKLSRRPTSRDVAWMVTRGLAQTTRAEEVDVFWKGYLPTYPPNAVIQICEVRVRFGARGQVLGALINGRPADLQTRHGVRAALRAESLTELDTGVAA